MAKTYEIAQVPEAQTVELVSDQRLVVEFYHHSNVLKIIGSDGEVSLSLHVTEDGPVLRIGDGTLTIKTEGNLDIDADRIAIHGREGLELTTGGDFQIQARGDMTSDARIQTITARLGNVNLKANDDVKLNGERIKMNC